MGALLKASDKQEVQYCIPLWLRDAQVKASLKRDSVGRIQPHDVRPGAKIAIVCFGPSLKETWEQVRDFDAIIPERCSFFSAKRSRQPA